MQKLVLIILFGGVFVGSVMPSRMRVASPSNSVLQAPRDYSSRRDQVDATKVDLGTGVVTLDRNSDGHFYADAQVNGTPVHFLVDTGATGIALTAEDARRASVPLGASDEVVGMGAGGELRGQFVSLDRVNLGIKEVRGARAAVIEGGDLSLLGQSFLSEFGSVSIEGDRMVLR